MEFNGLGKGLEAIIPVTEEPAPGVTRVPVSAITRNPMQPREHFDADALGELAVSIKEHGLIQPLIVTQQGPDRYQRITGERRWQAAKLAGLSSVDVIIKEATPQQQLELALVENVQRADLNPLEEAAAYRQLVDEFGLTVINATLPLTEQQEVIRSIVAPHLEGVLKAERSAWREILTREQLYGRYLPDIGAEGRK